jgi:CRISPR/Cas system Type II protein with McrA/HNH and RuvC-like nuclease domain
VIEHNGPVNCIYTQKPLDIGNYALEHFVPYAFVSHDMIWNLIPADPGFNSTKCDKLPSIDRYFDA